MESLMDFAALKEHLLQPVTDLQFKDAPKGIFVRVRNVLKNENIVFIAQIHAHPHLMGKILFPNFGKTSRATLGAALAQCGVPHGSVEFKFPSQIGKARSEAELAALITQDTVTFSNDFSPKVKAGRKQAPVEHTIFQKVIGQLFPERHAKELSQKFYAAIKVNIIAEPSFDASIRNLQTAIVAAFPDSVSTALDRPVKERAKQAEYSYRRVIEHLMPKELSSKLKRDFSLAVINDIAENARVMECLTALKHEIEQIARREILKGCTMDASSAPAAKV